MSAQALGLGVVGAGGWGTALAVLLARKGFDVTLWSRRSEHARELEQARENKAYLPGVPLPESVRITCDLREVARCSRLILAVPSQALRSLWERLRPLLGAGAAVLNTAKGLEAETGLRLSQVLEEGGFPADRICVLSGPNHAEEVGRGIPTSSVVAGRSRALIEEWQELLMGSTFRVYTNEDVIGVELGGALKNVIAIAAGISDGLGFGDNTKAALITRGLAEMSRLGVAMGANVITFAGLSGMGDLVATSTSTHSRNTQAGFAIGRGKTLQEVLRSTPMVIEGVPTCRAALSLAAAHGVEMPITRAVAQILFEGKSPRQAVAELMGRGPKSELEALFPPSPAE